DADSSPGGLVVVRVFPGSPAERVGLKQGDHIIAFNGSAISRGSGLIDLIGSKHPGDTNTLRVQGTRDGRPLDLAVVLGAHLTNDTAYLGVEFEMAERLEAPRLLTIQEVAWNGPAEKAGLRRHDLIIAANDREMKQPSDLLDLIAIKRPGEQLTLQ